MDSKICDVKTCEASMATTEATVVRIGNKEYDLCKDCAAIFFKWLEETFVSGRDIPIALSVPYTITSGYSDNIYWPTQPNTVPVNPGLTYPQITWTAIDPKDMNGNWLNCTTSYKN